LRGRGTRVFKAVEIDKDDKETGSIVVLKDIWIDHDRTREGDILAELCKGAVEEDKLLVKEYFLTTVCHGDVWIKEAVDDTAKGLMRGLSLNTNTFPLHRTWNPRPRIVPSGSEGLRATGRLHTLPSTLWYPHKTHYRIVFKEIGVTIDRLTTLDEVVKTLIGIVSGTY
jgi:Fungal protein kinase